MDLHGGNVYDIEEKYGLKRSEILDFSSNINPHGLPGNLAEALLQSIPGLVHYPDPHYRELRKSLAEYTQVEPGWLIPGNGAVELLFLAMRVLKPRTVLIAAPTFMEYERSVKQAGGRPCHFQLREEEGFVIDTPLLLEEMEQGYDLLMICNPNNPTGNFINPGEAGEIIRAAERHSTFVILDEAFIEFAGGGSMAPSAGIHQNLFILRSMTKFFAIPGLRLGYGISGNGALMEKMFHEKEPWTVNSMAECAGRIMVEERDYIQKTREWIGGERDHILQELSLLSSLKHYGTHANFVLIRLLNGLTASEIREALCRKGILIRDASNFTFLDEHYIRIAIKDRGSNERLLAELRALPG